MDMSRIRALLKKNPLIVNAYHQIKKASIQVDIPEITEVIPREDTCDNGELRLNLLVPSVDKKHVFGGIATALRFFEELAPLCACDVRIITVDAPVIPQSAVTKEQYRIVSSEMDSAEKKQLVAYSDRYQKSIPVRCRDVFIATGWWTAYTFKEIIDWQVDHFQQKALPLIYFIQDYEPGFYPWSSRYLMADSTYRLDVPTYAIVNSKLLFDFFVKEGYTFEKKWYFEPVLNEELKKYLPEKNETIKKKKQIIVYGRPGTARNAFEVVVAALRQWANMQPDVQEWKVFSAGEMHEPIALGKDIALVSLGKLSLQEYAECMLKTYAGISLMVSPHPSYPPLEMSTFGIKVITNNYGNKDLSSFNANMTGLDSASPKEIAKCLCELCSQFEAKGTVQVQNEYVHGRGAFGNVLQELADEILKISK